MKASKDAHGIRIAYIGGGSRAWSHKLMSDLALSDALTGELLLYDINFDAAKINEGIGEGVFAHRDSKTKFAVRAVKTLKEALKGADFVVISIEPGPTSMRYADLEIPLRYGILQPVADSTGPGGICRALRSIPIYEGYAKAIMDECPKAWVISYTNPMAVCTGALYAVEPKIKAFGCCHEVYGTQRKLASLIPKWFGRPAPDRMDIELDIAGLNHFTFATAASWKGKDLFPKIKELVESKGFFRDRTKQALERKRARKVTTSDNLIAFDFFANFGVLGAAGDRHLAEFVPWYLGSEETLHRWGVVLTPYSIRVDTAAAPPSFKLADPLKESGEEGVRQICALLGLGDAVTNVNIPNGRLQGFASKETIVESYALLSKDKMKPLPARPLPPLMANLASRIAQMQDATLKAGLDRDFDLALQALLASPLVNISTDKARMMLKEMLLHTKSMLPGWKLTA